MKRMRGRNHRPGGGGNGGGAPIRHQTGNTPLNRNHVFDSSGPDVRVRGTSQQLFEKYLQMGRDATSSGDRVMAEGYFQHAEHYFRILNAMNQAAQQGQGANQGQPNQQNGPIGTQHGGARRFGSDGDFSQGNSNGAGPGFSDDDENSSDGGNEPRFESRAEPGFESRPESRPEPRGEPRHEARAEPRPEPRHEARAEPRPEPRHEARAEPRPEPRAEAELEAELARAAVPADTRVEAVAQAPAERREPRARIRRERVERPSPGAAAPGTGDQPEAREIPIIAAPPES